MSYLKMLALLALLALWLTAGSASAQDHLLFCNTPERITMPGTYASAKLEPGETYLIFFHFKNFTGKTAPFVVGLQGEAGQPLRFDTKKGFADTQYSPSQAGRQAMARFLSAPERTYLGEKGYARFAFPLGNRQIASGIISIRAESAARLRIYFQHSKWDVKGSRVVAITAPRREVEIALSKEATRLYYRIGEPEKELAQEHFDGTYGMLYRFQIAAPEGRKVRVAFSPRGGKGGMVGSLNGKTIQSEIVPATHWRVFCETVVGKDGLILTTSPFGGVFYPVEILFELM